MNDLTLVVNLSLRSIRVLIFDNGVKLYEDWRPVRTYINENAVEQDPNEWWNLLFELLQFIFSSTEYAQKISTITVTSSALCLVAVDENGEVLDKSMMVSDKRAFQEAEEIKNTFSSFFKERPHFKCESGYMLPKILWIKNNKKNIFDKATMFLSSNDYLLYKLTDVYITDTLNAEKFYFQNNLKKYPQELLSFLGITEKFLPKVVDPGTHVGIISQDFKKALGIQQEIQVVVSTYDAICALIGGSTHTEGELSNVCGTCSSYRIFTHGEKKIQSDTLLVQSLEQENIHIIGASNNLEGGVLEWAKDCFYGDSFLKDDTFLYTLMQTEAQESELGANGIIFLPYLLGERMPFSDPDVRGSFFGIERFHTRKDIIRGVFEAICFQAKLVVEEFHKIGFEMSSITMSGGVAKIPFAAQLRADILGLPVTILEEVETTALGAHIFVLKAQKRIRSVGDISHLIKIKKTYIPNMHNNNCYSSLFILYKQIYTDHKEMFKQRKNTFEKIIHYRKKVLENL